MSLFPGLTVVVAVTGRHEKLREVFDAYDSVLRRRVAELSYIFVVDGGLRDAANELDALAAGRDKIDIVRLSGKFGESTALSIAFDAAQSEWILTLPPYLQIEPAGLDELLDKSSDQDLVTARRWPIRGYALNRMSNALFNRIVRLMTGLPFRDLGCGVRLLRKVVATEIPIYGGQHRFLPITASQRGFRVLEVCLPQATGDQKLKIYGVGTYSRRLIDLLTVFFLVKFTKRPLRFFGTIGFVSIAAGIAVLAITALERLLMSTPLADRPLFLLGLLFVALGVQFFAVGLIGELVIFVHAKELKEYAVLQQLNFDDESQDDPVPQDGETGPAFDEPTQHPTQV